MRPLLYTNLHIGLIAVAFLLGTYALLEIPPSLPLPILAFCGAFLVYHFERGLGLAPEDAYNQPDRLAWTRRHRTLYWVLAVAASLAAVAAMPLLQLRTLAACIGLGAVSLAYVVPVLAGGRRLKTVWALKPLLISGAWSAGGVLLPALEAGSSASSALLLLAASRFLFVLPNALLADWPDREGDARAGLRTVATVLPSALLHHALLPLLLLSMACAATVAHLTGRWALFFVDVTGPMLMLAVVARPLESHGRNEALIMDALVAWPGVTALAAALVF